ncbi:MAG: DegT/DnrJ/EryC1/StrS family aminotransferase [Gammaproteobacteria bacterium]|nr:DegT/DnrJ/EryC1/StrS family aminotransferase [Gammaproteobacteria bacterium]
MILFSNPRAQYQAHQDEMDAAVRRVLRSGKYILGENVEAFEVEFAQFLDIPYAVGVGSGTDALHLALRALGIGAGDEVIVPVHTAVATVAAVCMAQAQPVLVDIEENGLTIDPNEVIKAITPRTKAVIAVHLYGQPVELSLLLAICAQNHLKLIEDCAQATGACYKERYVGTWGDIGCFSFFPTKNLGAIGDGGMVVTRHLGIAEKIQRLRQYGWDKHRLPLEMGINSRLDEIQAAILRVKLPFLLKDNEKRVKLAEKYHKGLGDLPLVLLSRRPETYSVYHLYVIRTKVREALLNYLKVHNISPGIHYPAPRYNLNAYLEKIKTKNFPVTEMIAEQILSLPLYPELSEDDHNHVISTIRAFFKMV